MNPEWRAALERAGWRVGDVEDFLGLSEQERELVAPGAAPPRAPDRSPRGQPPASAPNRS